MSFTLEKPVPTVVVVHVGRALDCNNHEAFEIACHEHRRAGIQLFVLDFEGTQELGASGVGAIFELYRNLTPVGGNIVFACLSSPVKVVVQLTRIYKIFRQFPTIETAIEAIARPIPTPVGVGGNGRT